MDYPQHSRTYLQAKTIMSKLAVFDFDGTIYQGDSMRDFAKFLNPGRYYLSMLKLLVPYFQLVFGNTTRDALKAEFLAHNFTGYRESELNEKGLLFFDKYRNRCYRSAVNWIERERREGTQILILSGSCTPWLQAFANYFGADLVCTRLDFSEGTCNGKWIGKNITGQAKKEALAAYLQKQTDITYSMAFGNQDSDAISGALVDEYRQNYFHK